MSNFLALSSQLCRTLCKRTFNPTVLLAALLAVIQTASAEPKRLDGNSHYTSVGLIAYNGAPTCSGTIIKHGVMLTAKHCFGGRPYNESSILSWSVHLPLPASAGQGSILIAGANLKKIILDSGDNDIAYILYDPKATQGVISVEVKSFSSKDDLKPNPAAKVIGFPSQEMLYSKTPRVVAENCIFTGLFGKTPGYQGALAGTNCGAYWGVSGGPVFIEDLATHRFTKIVGVVAHTFAINKDGSIDTAKIQRDHFGKYINDTNVSPVADALNLNTVLLMDLSQIPNGDKIPRPTPKQACGYSSFTELMAEARKAVETVRTSTQFKPTF